MLNMKNLSIVVAGSGEIKDISIKPATKAGDILRDTELTGYVLSKGSEDAPFNPDDDVYAQVEDGQKLYAVTPADAGK